MSKFLKNARFYENITLDGSLYFQDTSTYIKRNADKELVFEDPSAGIQTLSTLAAGGAIPAQFSSDTAWVNDSTGNDSTGEAGNILKPFKTVQAAIDALSGTEKHIYITSNITEDFQLIAGTARDLRIYLQGEIVLDASLFVDINGASAIIGDGQASFTGSVEISSPGTSLFRFQNLNEINQRPGSYIFEGRDLEIDKVRWIEGDYNAFFKTLGNIKITDVGQIVNTNDASANAYIFDGGSLYLRNIGLIQVDNSSGRINQSHGYQGERLKEAFNVTFKSEGSIWATSYPDARMRSCRLISNGIPIILDDYFANYGAIQLFDCHVDTSSNRVINVANANTGFTVMNLIRNCEELHTGSIPAFSNIYGDVYLEDFKINNPWYTYPYDNS